MHRCRVVRDKVRSSHFYNCYLGGLLDKRCLAECPQNSMPLIDYSLSVANKRGKSVHKKSDNKAVVLQTRQVNPIIMNLSS